MDPEPNTGKGGNKKATFGGCSKVLLGDSSSARMQRINWTTVTAATEAETTELHS